MQKTETPIQIVVDRCDPDSPGQLRVFGMGAGARKSRAVAFDVTIGDDDHVVVKADSHSLWESHMDSSTWEALRQATEDEPVALMARNVRATTVARKKRGKASQASITDILAELKRKRQGR